MSAAGRPLRFFALVLGGWVGARVALLWPDAVPVLPDAAAAEVVVKKERRDPVALAAKRRGRVVATVSPPPAHRRRPPAITHVASLPPPAPAMALPVEAAPEPASLRYGAIDPPRAHGSRRLTVSAWSILRGSTGQRSSVATPQLGASQAGVRVAFALDDVGRFALAARVAGAIGVRQQDAAIGVEWRPTRLPLRLVAEQRIGIANARGGASLGFVGGVSQMSVAAGFHLDGYGQAGVIARSGAEGYADGAVRLTRAVRPGGVPIDLGVGAWGATQRGAARLDVGPSAGVALPVGEAAIRMSLHWRHRIAGDARPASGPALSIGTDF
jgi:hypothetical protein